MNELAKQSHEYQQCSRYLEISKNEILLDNHSKRHYQGTTLIVTEGFEERSVGILEFFAGYDSGLSNVVISKYSASQFNNDRYNHRFNTAARSIAGTGLKELYNNNDGLWIKDALSATSDSKIILDITGLSNRGLFNTLDAALASGKEISIAYSEAKQYWPKESDWNKLQAKLSAHTTLAETIDKQSWLFGYDHKVEYIPGHEGYDSVGNGRALLAFLPFKSARLAAVLSEDDYSEFVFIAGQPRLDANKWRLNALLRINEDIVKDRRPVIMPTFGYRVIFGQMMKMLLELQEERSLLEKYDIHFGIMGSKLQAVACWALSYFIPSITFLTSSPSTYYSEAFSSGIGSRWMFPLTSPLDQDKLC